MYQSGGMMVGEAVPVWGQGVVGNLCFFYCFSIDLNCSKKCLLLESVLMRWMNLELIIQSEVSQKKINIVY